MYWPVLFLIGRFKSNKPEYFFPFKMFWSSLRTNGAAFAFRSMLMSLLLSANPVQADPYRRTSASVRDAEKKNMSMFLWYCHKRKKSRLYQDQKSWQSLAAGQSTRDVLWRHHHSALVWQQLAVAVEWLLRIGEVVGVEVLDKWDRACESKQKYSFMRGSYWKGGSGSANSFKSFVTWLLHVT